MDLNSTPIFVAPGMWMLYLAGAIIAAVLWHTRRLLQEQRSRLARVDQMRVELQAQAEHARSLRTVMKRHLTQSLAMRSQVRSLHSHYRDLETRLLQANALERAIRMIRQGRSLESMLRRGELNAAEAHLIRSMHRKRKQSA